MREDALYTCTELGNDLRHTLTGLSKSGAMNIGLSRYTPHIETSSTNIRTLEDYHLQTLFGGIFSGAVPTRARTDDNQINLRH
jgi:hypothetical protein